MTIRFLMKPQTLKRRPLLLVLPMLAVALIPVGLWQPVAASRTQEQKHTSQSPAGSSGVDVDRIIRAFTAKETEFRRALAEYAFERDVTIQTIGPGGQVTGEYHRGIL